MEKTLLRSFYIACFSFLLTLFGIFTAADSAKGQLLLQPDRPVTLHFDNYRGNGFSPEPASGQLNSSLWILEGSAGAPDTDFNRNGRLDFEESTGTSGYYGHGFWNERSGRPGLYALSLESGNRAIALLAGPDSSSLTLRLRNQADTPINNISLSYDLLALKRRGPEGSVAVNLSYSNDNRHFREVREGAFSTSALSRRKSGWRLHAVSTMLDRIVIPAKGAFFLKWTFKTDVTDGAGNLTDGIAFDNLKIEAGGQKTDRKVRPGDIVVTEMGHARSRPQTRTGVTDYVELYNRTNHPVNLNGMLVSTGDEIHVIEREKPLLINPYSFLVLERAATFQEEESGFYVSATFPALHAAGGEFIISTGSDTLARARYDSLEEDPVVFELRDVATGADGVAEASDYRTVRGGSGGFPASAGAAGNTKLNYAFRLPERTGWHLLTLPVRQSIDQIAKSVGSASGNRKLNREHQQVYRLKADAGSMEGSMVEAGQSLLLKMDSDKGNSTLSLEGAPSTGDRELSLVQAGTHWKLAGNPFLKPLDLSSWPEWIGPGAIESRVVQVWDDSTGSFVPSTLYQDHLPAWGSFLIESDDADQMTLPRSATIEENRPPEQGKDQRFLAFHLSNGKTSGRSVSDKGSVLYFGRAAGNGWDDFDALKVEPFPKSDAAGEYTAYIYLRGEKGGRQVAKSQDSRPFSLQDRLSIDLALVALQYTGPMVLDWKEQQNIPSEWKMTLIDHETGRKIDMQKNRSYSFDVTDAQVMERQAGTGEVPGIKTVQPAADRTRFSVVLEAAKPKAREVPADQPETVTLQQNYPNPFNPSTVISFDLPEKAYVRLGVYNVVGQKVASLVDGVQDKGSHKVTWDGSENPSGIYIYQLEVNGKVYTRKMTLIK